MFLLSLILPGNAANHKEVDQHSDLLAISQYWKLFFFLTFLCHILHKTNHCKFKYKSNVKKMIFTIKCGFIQMCVSH